MLEKQNYSIFCFKILKIQGNMLFLNKENIYSKPILIIYRLKIYKKQELS